jgi:CRISPR/Cas system CMR-associated protein Cmr5 small subunit
MSFLMSNNHLNAIIAVGYELRDEEGLAQIIALLKAISFMINTDTIQFFLKAESASRCAAGNRVLFQLNAASPGCSESRVFHALQ